LLGEADPYAMAVSVVDEAVRNAVAVGADPERIAILDNFCWGDPLRPETLGSLVRAAQGCHNAALHHNTPFISGKDTLNNEFTGSDGTRQAIPGTLLISSIGIHRDIRKAVTMDLKKPGNRIYLIGDWTPALAGSHALVLGGAAIFENSPALGQPPTLPDLAPQVYAAFHQAIQAGLVRAAHDLSEGGLAVAAAEMALAGRIGLELDLSILDENPALGLFAETNGCLLVEVAPDKIPAFEACFANLPIKSLGEVTSEDRVVFIHHQSAIIGLPLSDLVNAFKGAEN
jgi:phosphoribosylformylglycinamidine (FGAM) synthase-like enzyme